MKDERIYVIDGQKYPSVTTILAQMDKSGALMGWAVNMTIEYLKANPQELINDPDNAFKNAKKWHSQVSQEAKDLGSKVHNLIEVYLKGQKIHDVAEDVSKPFEAFRDWQNTYKFELIKSEHIISSKQFKYAGTLDCIAKLNDKVYLVDFKTSKAIYDEYIIQVAAYLKAYEELTKEKVEGAGILRLDKKTGIPEWKEISMDTIDYQFEIFKCFLKAWWLKKEANNG